MKKIKEILAEASRFKMRRSSLAQDLRNVDITYRNKLAALESSHASTVRAFEAERQSALAAIESRAKKEIADYIQMKNNLQSYIVPVRQWCPQNKILNYTPNPSRVNEIELNKLITMLQEQGVIAWLKRTFRIGGYSSREDMAFELCCKIEDACSFCNEKIASIEARAESERSAQVTQTRRKMAEQNEKFNTAKRELEAFKMEEKEKALTAIGRFDNSVELKNMHDKLEQLRIEAENSCGAWGEYATPSEMPEQVLLCEAKVSLPNNHGVDETRMLPVWLNMYESNIIVITSSGGSVSGTNTKEKLFVRKLLSRMLKTVPPEYCNYSVFDSLHKGASLERLIDVTNVGTTDLNFDVFTSEKSEVDTVSCAERRRYLRNRPAEIVKHIAGRSESLFEHNRATGAFDYPFSWYVDFNFPDSPDTKLLEDLKEIFVNSFAAGYSFVFVTTPGGYKVVKELAQQYTKTSVMHIDVDNGICEKGDVKVEYLGSGSPESDQIYNFMTALKKFYDDGCSVDNRIDSVFGAKGVELRDASKKLTVPMALDSRGRLVDFELGGEGSVHGFISGGTNSGKSTLLHTIILSACLHYHPQDLEIWLVDYKKAEFHLYKNKKPPHVKLIGISKTADFTYSLIDRIISEGERRTDLMNHFEVQNLTDYRKHKGEPGYVNIPRLLIVIDEFHEMSQFVSTETEYKDKLENILREYRAQGINCLLADQTFSSGLSGLSTAAKNQIGLRIAMKNDVAPQEIKDTLEVDRAMYSDSMQHAIDIMSQGDFIMKVNVRDSKGNVTDIKLEKFKGLWAKGEDIGPISKALRSMYKGQYTKGLLYVNTTEHAVWDDAEPKALDEIDPLRYPNMRLYLGRAATLNPCFGLDMGRQPDENLSVVGGTALQRWELIASIMRSCKYRNYKLIVFMAEFSDLMSDHGDEIRALCSQIPNAELYETTGEWCEKLSEFEKMLDGKNNTEDTICLFIGLEIANIEFGRLPDKNATTKNNSQSFTNRLSKMLISVEGENTAPAPVKEESVEFNALPIIDKLFSSGARNGVRCITEVSVYRQFSKILKIKDMCRHKIAFDMSADDCLRYLGKSSFQKSIESDAVYSDGGKDVKKLIPYKLSEE